MPVPPSFALALLMALLMAAGARAAVSAPHQHGVAALSVAVDGNTLSIGLDGPLDGFLGFERAPRTDAERKAAADLMARLKSPDGLFNPDAAAGCKAGAVDVKADALAPGPRLAQGEHADLEVQVVFDCARPAALRQLDVGLFEAFERLQRIDVQVAGAKSQAKVTLKRPARVVPLVPPTR